MKEWKGILCAVLLVSLLLRMPWEPAWAAEGAEEGVMVSSREEFMSALEQKKSPIVVDGLITIGDQAEEGGRMLPVMIPGGTVIRGKGEGSILNSRSPIQLMGDGVEFQSLELTFESSDALGSVPHREIFLAGHSLTMDAVDTYLEGGDWFGGTEDELLPTVYGGGFTGSAVGDGASLTVRNSTKKTMFQKIVMGHGEDADRKAPYNGSAVVQLDASAIVRDGVDVRHNSGASIVLSDEKYDKSAGTVKFYGNEGTSLVIRRCQALDAVVTGVASILLEDRGCLAPKLAEADGSTPKDPARADGGAPKAPSAPSGATPTEPNGVTPTQPSELNDITVKTDGCLDLSRLASVRVKGDFAGKAAGEEGKEGLLVLRRDGRLTIDGAVTGTTRFQTDYRAMSGVFFDQWDYIRADAANISGDHFILSERDKENGISLQWKNGAWTASHSSYSEDGLADKIEVTPSSPSADISGILERPDGSVPDEGSFFKILWKDSDGNALADDVVEDEWLYGPDYVICVKTEYWESEDPDVLLKTDWGNAVGLLGSAEHPGTYFLYAQDGAKTGSYTFLLCSRPIPGALSSVADVKALKDIIKAEAIIRFYDSGKEDDPEHEHRFASQLRKEATCQETGERFRECVDCGYAYTQILPKKAHTIEEDPAVAASCVKEGWSEGCHCSVCGEVIRRQQRIPKLSHHYQEEVTKAEPNVNGTIVTACAYCGEAVGERVLHCPKKAKLSFQSCVYNGKARRPKVVVEDADGNEMEERHYSLVYRKNKDVGIASVQVRFQGIYAGVMTKTFQIKPRPTSIVKLTAKAGGFQVKWKKKAGQSAGYWIQYSTNKKFTGKATKSVFAKKNADTSKTVKKLSSGKTYYVRVCTYKNVKQKKKTARLASKWSKAHTVTVL